MTERTVPCYTDPGSPVSFFFIYISVRAKFIYIISCKNCRLFRFTNHILLSQEYFQFCKFADINVILIIIVNFIITDVKLAA